MYNCYVIIVMQYDNKAYCPFEMDELIPKAVKDRLRNNFIIVRSPDMIKDEYGMVNVYQFPVGLAEYWVRP